MEKVSCVMLWIIFVTQAHALDKLNLVAFLKNNDGARIGIVARIEIIAGCGGVLVLLAIAVVAVIVKKKAGSKMLLTYSVCMNVCVYRA